MTRRLRLAAGLLVAGLLLLTTACASGPTTGDEVSDTSHTFRLHSAQIVAGRDEGSASLVIDYEVGNLTSQTDTVRSWPEMMTLASGDEEYPPAELDSLPGELRQTTLASGQWQRGRTAFAVPDDFADFTLTVSLPVSATTMAFDFRPLDRRLAVNAGQVLTKLQQIARTKRIPVIGGLLASLSTAPLRYLGTVLVPEDEVDDLLARTDGLPDPAATAVIEGYLSGRGLGGLE